MRKWCESERKEGLEKEVLETRIDLRGYKIMHPIFLSNHLLIPHVE